MSTGCGNSGGGPQKEGFPRSGRAENVLFELVLIMRSEPER